MIVYLKYIINLIIYIVIVGIITNMYIPSDIEQKSVIDVYDTIFESFADTRYNVWNAVKIFLDKQVKDTYGLEIGCGNGKNMRYAIDIGLKMAGIDTCRSFVDMCRKKYKLDVCVSNAIQQIYVDELFDFAISIAVFHHLSTEDHRIKVLQNMINVLKSKGSGLVTVWAVEQDSDSKRNFVPGDNMVTWYKPYYVNNVKKYTQYDRYYYVFNKQMFLDYINTFRDQIEVNRIYNEKGNWICDFTKK